MPDIWDGQALSGLCHVGLCIWCGEWSVAAAFSRLAGAEDVAQALVEEALAEHEVDCRPNLADRRSTERWLES